MKIFNYLFLFFFLLTSDAYSLTSIKELIRTRPMDKKIFNLSKPATLNYVMVPVVGMVDTFWVSKLGSSNQLAGAGSGDQIFSIFYVLTSFLPAIITPKITELQLQDKKQETNELISTSILLTNILGIFTTIIMIMYRKNLITMFVGDTPLISNFTNEYFKYRSLGMCFSLTNSLIFSILRGFMDFNSAIKINLKSQIINVVLDPIFMKYYGLKGVAIASVLSDIYCTFNYAKLLISENRYTTKITNFYNKSIELLKQGSFIQIKNTLNNFMYLYINKKILFIDKTGVLLASQIILIKFLELCFITFSGLYSVSNILIPSQKIIHNDKEAKNRLLYWSVILGIGQSFLLFNSQFLLSYLTSDVNVIEVCKNLIGLISIYQIVYGHSYILEGILQGYQKFKESGIANIISLIPMIGLIYLSKNLTHLWGAGIVTMIIKCIYLHISIL